ncbi:hypothetical protein ASD99_21945 [Mesorhizobium sp. Root695]|uniref:DUF4145 domain-containing protein n=1 Tax=unclassified Mesorhizobium TaxID=325217 RepID=UPI0006F9FA5E|nr:MULTISPECIES: DUF4145 domain-containing protein [unclassified Mesorhizobium]KQU91352.1 hypothetical protein ASD12_26785 [Mesorhizobium sp. Root102]KRB30558.1 hypothetical protein ASD99_21945 [Mesorhizobium sp. Root695]
MNEWTCPFCQRHQIRGNNTRFGLFDLPIGDTALGRIGIVIEATRCLNALCNQPSIKADLRLTVLNAAGNRVALKDAIESWKLRPSSFAKPQPDYVPAPLTADYREACAIRDLSPKAAATLARRCLQGMIRDFCGITKKRLIDEIKALRLALDEGTAPPGVAAETVDAIDAIREVGNIGAHMESDIDMIVEVEPGEAQALIELIEMLFEEWYVARETRSQRLAKVKAIAAQKSADLAEMKAQAALTNAADLD